MIERFRAANDNLSEDERREKRRDVLISYGAYVARAEEMIASIAIETLPDAEQQEIGAMREALKAAVSAAGQAIETAEARIDDEAAYQKAVEANVRLDEAYATLSGAVDSLK